MRVRDDAVGATAAGSETPDRSAIMWIGPGAGGATPLPVATCLAPRRLNAQMVMDRAAGFLRALRNLPRPVGQELGPFGGPQPGPASRASREGWA